MFLSSISHRNEGFVQPIAAVHRASSSTPTRFQNKSNYFFGAILFFGLPRHRAIFRQFTNCFLFKLYLETTLEETLKREVSNYKPLFSENKSVTIFQQDIFNSNSLIETFHIFKERYISNLHKFQIHQHTISRFQAY